MTMHTVNTPQQAVQHLQPELWNKVNRLLVRKAISEFAHELLITPERLATLADGWAEWRIAAGDAEYRFRAQPLMLEHWRVDADSIVRRVAGQEKAPDALDFIVEFRDALGLSEQVMPVYLDEISSTLYGSAFKHGRAGLSADELTRADFQSVETGMMEGHPCFIANNGRIGFSAGDYHAYAPEAGSLIQLVWLAVHKDRATFSHVSDLDYARLMREELGDARLADFNGELVRRGLNPDDYLFMPAHPWQWHNKLAMAFSAEIATGHIVCLGQSDDAYLAQQSIRTFFNVSQPTRRYVKMALSILNMGFMRGLSPYYMEGTPAINEWVKELVDADPYLNECGFTILREVAAVGYRNRYYEAAIAGNPGHKKMLSALWRESPLPLLQPGQRLMTMASLLHVDRDGQALLPALIASSGLDAASWLRSYLKAYLAPIVHCFHRHDMVFMPHGENLILVLDNNVPVRALMKDIAEEVGIINSEVELPPIAERISVQIPDHLKTLSIFTDVFDCFFRHLAAILVEHAGLPEDAFWREVAACVAEYERAHPQMEAKFRRYDLFEPTFIRSCLNRLQLADNQQMIDLADPAKKLQFVGTLDNPIARFRESV